MRTQSEIKKNNIRKANLLKEHNHRTNKGTMNTKFGLYEQCGVSPRDTEGVYMGAPAGTEPMNDMMGMDMGMEMGMMGNEDMPMDMGMGMMSNDMEGMDDDDMPMNDEMMMMFMNEDYEEEDHKDRDKFDGRKGEVVGVDFDIDDEDDLMENYKAFNAKPKRDSWGNEYNQILTENTQVNGVNSLIHRMTKVIK